MSDKVKMVRAEVQKDPDKPRMVKERTFTYEGVQYTLRGDSMEDVELVELLEDEKYISLLRKLVGPAKWAEFKDSVRTEDGRVPLEALRGFLEIVMEKADPQVAS